MTEAEKLAVSLRDLKESLAWTHITKVLDESAMKSALSLGSEPEMSRSAVDYTRGAIRGMKELKALPDYLLMQLDAEIAINRATQTETEKT